MPAPRPADEAARLSALHSYALLDTAAEPSFDRVTALVARLLGVPIALVSLVDAERQWFKSCVGMDGVRETGRDVAFCAYAILANDVFVVPDATADPRYADNPLVTGAPHIRAYAGAPLVTPSGARIGTLCAIDQRPRDFTGEQLATLVDLAAIVVSEMELRRTARERKLFERVSQLSPTLMYLVDATQRRTVWSNHGTAELLGYDPGALPDAPLASVLHADDLRRAATHVARSRSIADGETNEGAFRVRAANGEYRWVLARETPFARDERGDVTEVLGIAADVTELKAAEDRAVRSERALAERVDVLHAILETAGEGILVAALDGKVMIANPPVRALLDASSAHVLPGDPSWPARMGLFHQDEETLFTFDDLPLRRAMRGERVDRVPLFVRNDAHPDGIHLQITGRPLHDAGGQVRGAVMTLSDVTELRRAERRLASLAVTDELTKLPNRRALRERLELLAAEAARGRRFSVAIADIDFFKKVNDVHGHAAGDAVLVAVAAALRATVRRSDLVARMGGEEFCIVQTDVDPVQMTMLTERLRAAVASIAEPLAITASFGVCHSTTCATPDAMLAAADAALYRAKRGGRDRVEVA